MFFMGCLLQEGINFYFSYINKIFIHLLKESDQFIEKKKKANAS